MADIRAELPMCPFPPTDAAAPLAVVGFAPERVTVLTMDPIPGSETQAYKNENTPSRPQKGGSDTMPESVAEYAGRPLPAIHCPKASSVPEREKPSFHRYTSGFSTFRGAAAGFLGWKFA